MSYRKRFAVAAAGLAFLLTGCAGEGGEKDAPAVATLQSGAAPSAASGGDQRPVYPIDATDDQVEAIAKPWTDCLRKQGAGNIDDAVLMLIQKGGNAEDLSRIGLEKDAAAWRACESRQPESVEQHQLRTDPTGF